MSAECAKHHSVVSMSNFINSFTMIQLLFNINLVLAATCFGIGLIMLIGVTMDAVSNAKRKQS